MYVCCMLTAEFAGMPVFAAQPVELSITRWDSLVDAVRSSAVADGTATVVASRQLKSSL